MSLNASLFDFLRDLAANNQRDWFQAHQAEFRSSKAQVDALAERLLPFFQEIEHMEGLGLKDCTYRIYRDVRFSKDKAPYKHWFSLSFGCGGKKSKYLDYYLHLQPDGASFLAAGMYAPSSEDLQRWRQEVDYNGAAFLAIIEDPAFAQRFSPWPDAPALKKCPKPYPQDHPLGHWLKLKQVIFIQPFSDAEVLSMNFETQIQDSAVILKPFVDFMNAALFEKEPK